MTVLDRRFSIAPMMDWSDRHCRYFWRLLTQQSLLYTEMITTGALIHGDIERHLQFDPSEHPIAVQLGGNNPADLAHCAKLCEERGYDEVNLNVGCPSDRVKSGFFGACLMNQPQTVADGIKAMRDAVDIPVTIKCRIGVDDNDSYEALCEFVDVNAQAGCEVFIIHARKAWLSGLSPKQNREVPPLDYPRVFKLKQDFPHLSIVLNGGLKTIDDCHQALEQLDGVMIGREAYQNPSMLQYVDNALYGSNHTELPKGLDSGIDNDLDSGIDSGIDKLADSLSGSLLAAHRFAEYMDGQLTQGVRLNHMTRHLLGLFNGQTGARAYRRHISENANKAGAGIDVFMDALAKLGTPS
ncbi:MAG: tRNA dihydrouridine(20/20a) synthase DusA [Cellvibrionales bacterium]|jgi:tRNA-dihydrouridine synthase A|nr:tRNA dihydrouridine(20/20a) synthase DusA [Cellvibrionales bacterium]